MRLSFSLCGNCLSDFDVVIAWYKSLHGTTLLHRIADDAVLYITKYWFLFGIMQRYNYEAIRRTF